ncbi:MAG: Rieske 2Fe-2S domain-containing protein [Pseudomonadota bacterium]
MAKTSEYGLGEFTYPRGWFMVADSSEVKDRPVAIKYFGEEMVVYRGESGKPYVVEAHCPHMGAHLAKNSTSYVVIDNEQIEGEDIRCPYHAWKFGPDGRCNHIPYSPAPVPEAARLRTWPTVERAGSIFVWHDEEGGEPDYDVPPIVEWDDPSWVRWTFDHLGELDCHPVEIVDNMVDRGHFTPIHGSAHPEYFRNKFDGHVITQEFAAGHKTLSDEVLVTDTWYTGPGILLSKMDGYHPSIIQITHTPIEDGRVRAWHALLVKSADAENPEAGVQLAREYQEASRLALMQDFEIWANKRPCFKTMQVIGDGPFGRLRTWYKQFYNSREQAGALQDKANGYIPTRGTRLDPWPTAAE